MLNRRRMLAIGGVVGGAALLPELIDSPVASGGAKLHDHGISHLLGKQNNDVRPYTNLPEFAVQMPIPPVLAPYKGDPDIDFYRVAIRPANVEILPGLQTPALTFNGGFTGPTIRARTGRPAWVTYTNQLTEAANVHLHGGHTPADQDGHPMDVIAPGATRTYMYPNTQQGATLWYHDHSHHTEAEHVYYGMHGFYLIDDPAERGLNLPSGEFDVPIMLREALIDSTGTLVFGSEDPPNALLANGKATPFFPVAARKYRFRLANSGVHKVFNLNLGGAEMIQIASDGGLLPAPVSRTELRIASAERQEIVIDFSRYPVGTSLVLGDTDGPVLRFDVVRTAPDTSRVPSTLRPLPPMPPATMTRDISLSFDVSGPEVTGDINGKPFDPNRVDIQIRRGTTEIWNVRNADPVEFEVEHPFHLHQVQFRVLSRNGNQPPGPDDMGRKDTVLLPSTEWATIEATFGDYLGRYVYHCHFLGHSQLGMMAQMEIIP